MGPFHIVLRIGSAHSNVGEQALTGEPFFDQINQRLEIVTGPDTKIQYPTVNNLGGLGIGFDEIIGNDFSIKAKYAVQVGSGTVSVPAYGAYGVTGTGVYFGITSSKKWMAFGANGVQVVQVFDDLLHVKKPLRVDGDAQIFGNVLADDFILASVNKVFQLTGGGALVDTVIYDTREDSDGGAWRERTNYSSWSNEVPSSTRSSRKKFPARAIIVATANWLSIYDGDDITLPLWARFVIGSSNHLIGNIQSVDAFNGSIYVGTETGGVFQIDFIRDVTFNIRTTGSYQSSTPIAARNLSTNYFIRLAQYGSQYWLPSDNVKAVSVNYSLNLVPNRVTKLPEPCIDMVFEAGSARLLSNRVILRTAGTSTDVYMSLHTARNGDVFSYNFTANRIEAVRAHQSNPSFDIARTDEVPSMGCAWRSTLRLCIRYFVWSQGFYFKSRAGRLCNRIHRSSGSNFGASSGVPCRRPHAAFCRNVQFAEHYLDESVVRRKNNRKLALQLDHCKPCSSSKRSNSDRCSNRNVQRCITACAVHVQRQQLPENFLIQQV